MLETIVVREPNSQLPEAFSKTLLEKHPTGFSYAAPQKDTHIENEPFPGDDVDLETTIKTVEESYEKDRVYYYFVQAKEDEINFESMQPFNLLVDDEGRALLSVMLAGHFPDYEDKNQDGETFTPAYHVVNSFLKGLLDEMIDIVGKDVGMLMAALDKKAQRDKLNVVLGDSGATILFIPCKGKSMAISNGKSAGQWKWGFSTNNFDYKEEAAPAVAATTSGKPLTMKEKAELRAKEKSGNGDTIHAAALPPGGTAIKPEEAFAAVLKDKRFALEKNVLIVKPSPGTTWKEAKTFWNAHCKLPRPDDAAILYKGFPADELRPNSPLFDLKARLMGEGVKTADSKQGPAKPEEKEKKDPAGMTLFLPTEKKNKYLELKKAGKFEMATESELKACLKDYPLTSISLGENFNEMLWWKPPAIARFVHDVGSHAAICYIHELRCRLLGIVDEKEEIEELPGVKKEATPPAETKKPLSMKEKAELRKNQAA